MSGNKTKMIRIKPIQKGISDDVKQGFSAYPIYDMEVGDSFVWTDNSTETLKKYFVKDYYLI